MRVLYEFIDGPRECSYLPEQQALLEYQFVSDLTPEDYQSLINGNFRKFGNLIFRPVCISCSACRALRILINSFQPDRSMRRCIDRNRDITLKIGSAGNSDEIIRLYNLYHHIHGNDKNWKPSSITQDEYTTHFLESEIDIEEIALYQGNTLIGIILFEELPDGLSLIYHFYDPSQKQRGLGTFLILQVIELARQRKKAYAYAGYFVAASKSMEYKAKFQANEILVEGQWQVRNQK